MRKEWKVGDLVQHESGRHALVVEIEQLLPWTHSTEAYLIEQDGGWAFEYPYEVSPKWANLGPSGLQYKFTSADQVQQDFQKGLFNDFFPL